MINCKYCWKIFCFNVFSENEPNIAVALSENSCEIQKLSNQQVATLAIFSEYEDKIFDCKFSKQDNNLIYTSSRNGSITLWDIRTPKKSVIRFLGIVLTYFSKFRNYK